MPEQFQFNQRADFSPIIGENKIIAASVGPSGEAVLLTVAPKFEKEPFGREERKGFAIFPFSKAKRHYPAMFIRFDGHQVLQTVELREVEIAFPSVQPLPNGEVLLVGSRCHYREGDPEQNAVVFDENGNVQRRFVLGDGINALETTADGRIWVSYFDEGVFGNYGWDKPMGSSGLICFDPSGQIVWEFTPPDGFDTICDCYAMNVTDGTVWACYYSEFPLVKIDSKSRVRGWKNEISGANALAVDDKRVLLWGGYGDNHSRCVVQEFGDKELVNPRELTLSFPHGVNSMGARVAGRGPVLHAFVETTWFTFDLSRVR
jgi:hypothetical protein